MAADNNFQKEETFCSLALLISHPLTRCPSRDGYVLGRVSAMPLPHARSHSRSILGVISFNPPAVTAPHGQVRSWVGQKSFAHTTWLRRAE